MIRRQPRAMAGRRPKAEGKIPVVSKENSKGKHLIYTQKFKGFVRRNKGIISKFFMSARQQAIISALRGRAVVFRGDNIVVRKLRRKGNVHRNLWRVDVGSKSFFVKETGAVFSRARAGHSVLPTDLGPRQFEALSKLKQYETRHVKIVKFHLGWTDKKKSFFVTDFYELKKLDLDRVPRQVGFEAKNFMQKALDLDIKDIKEDNMFYDPQKNIVIVFDPR